MNERANSQGDGDEADAGCDGLDLGIPALDRHPSHQLERCRSQDSRSGSDKFIKVVDTRNDGLAKVEATALCGSFFTFIFHYFICLDGAILVPLT